MKTKISESILLENRVSSFELQVEKNSSFDDFPLAIQRLFEGWTRVIEQRMQAHLTNLGGEANGAVVVLSVVTFEMMNERLLDRTLCNRTLRVHVTGQFAGKELDFHVENRQSLDLREIAPKSRMASDMTLIGKPAYEGFIRKIANEPNGNVTMSDEQIEDEPFFANFNLNLIEEFDRHTGRDQDVVVVRCKQLQWVSRIGAAIVLIAVTALSYHELQVQQQKTNQQAPVLGRLMASVLMGVMAAAPAWLMLFSTTASFMPIEFFKRHASGQRVLKFIGSQDPKSARLVLRFAPWVLAGVALFMWYQYISMSKR